MTNYRTTIENLIEKGVKVDEIKNEVNKVNEILYKEHCLTLAKSDNIFNAIYENNSCTIFRFNEKERTIKEVDKKVKSADVEKAFRLEKSKATNKNGKALPNNDVTIFGDFKVICALHSFIKKCNNEVTKEVYTFDKKKFHDNVTVLDFSHIMDSKTALDNAINNVLKVVGVSATYKKKYNDGLKHFATKQKLNAKGVTITDTSVYDLMDYIIDCCKDRVTVKLSYIKEVKQK